jgi:D-alanyl-D-alanine carboxypeptidase/D-alanyl-D-alanine-endopeptidase (penicillin-binding protein 4)
VSGVAGYVLSDSGRRYVLVAIINHPQAGAARPALDALVQWTLRDAPQLTLTPSRDLADRWAIAPRRAAGG